MGHNEHTWMQTRRSGLTGRRCCVAGSFIWPGVRVGHTTIVERVQGLGRLAMRTVSMQPLVFSVDGFLYDSECDYIRRAASPHMAQSGVTLMDHDRGKVGR